MRKMIIFLTLLITTSSSYAACSYTIKKEDFKVEWVAFKTPAKVGVKGSFDKLGVAKDKTAKDINSLLKNIPFNIDGASVNTNNKDRDKKIAKFFFKPMGSYIQGKIINLKKKKINLSLTMNEVTKTIPLSATVKDGVITASGYIDVLDFDMSNSLKGINNACKELHEGKTWNDVEIKLSAKYTKQC